MTEIIVFGIQKLIVFSSNEIDFVVGDDSNL